MKQRFRPRFQIGQFLPLPLRCNFIEFFTVNLQDVQCLSLLTFTHHSFSFGAQAWKDGNFFILESQKKIYNFFCAICKENVSLLCLDWDFGHLSRIVSTSRLQNRVFGIGKEDFCYLRFFTNWFRRIGKIIYWRRSLLMICHAVIVLIWCCRGFAKSFGLQGQSWRSFMITLAWFHWTTGLKIA